MSGIAMNMTDDADHSDEIASDKPWKDIILACFAINIVTLAGIALTAVTRYCIRKKHKSLIETLIVPSFAAGALLATAAFLLIPESLELLIEAGHAGEEEEHAEEGHFRYRYLEEEHHEDEAHAEEEELHEGEGAFAWKFGAALLGGFLLPLLMHTLLPRAQTVVEECEACQQDEQVEPMLSPAARELVSDDDVQENDDNTADKIDSDKAEDMKTMESGCDAHDCHHANHQAPETAMEEASPVINKDAGLVAVPPAHKPINLPLTLSILLGDAIHNFTDGVFLSNAFLLCSRDIAWTMVATTIYHELAQELADYIVLTSHCGLSIWKALLLNFFSGFSVLLGAVVILLADLSNTATGVILAISGGVYLYITAVECVPRVLEFTKGQRKLFFVFLCMFALGAVPIGLVLLNHGHCGSE